MLSHVIGGVTAHLAHIGFFLFTKSLGNSSSSSPCLKGFKKSYQDGLAARDALTQLPHVGRPLFQDKAG